jgi:hypothetical protein
MHDGRGARVRAGVARAAPEWRLCRDSAIRNIVSIRAKAAQAGRRFGPIQYATISFAWVTVIENFSESSLQPWLRVTQQRPAASSSAGLK